MLEKTFFSYALTFLSFYQFNTPTLNSKKILPFHFPAHWLFYIWTIYYVSVLSKSLNFQVFLWYRFLLDTVSSLHFLRCSVPQSCLTLCDPMDYSTPGLPVHHQLPELAQTHVHWVSVAIKAPHPLSSPSPPSFSLSQHQGLFFVWGGQSIGVSASASVLPMNIQDWFPLGYTGWISLQSKGLSRVFSSTSVQKHQFFSTQLSLKFI